MSGKWILGKRLAENKCAEICLCTRAGSEKLYVMKTIKIKSLFSIEIEALKSLDHPHIVKFVDTFDNVIVMEYGGDTDLFDYIIGSGFFPIDTIKNLFRQIVTAVAYCHLKGLPHRDIKLENVAYNTLSGKCMLIDFGFATNEFSRSVPGTPHYMAPEMYDYFASSDKLPFDLYKADIWALGVMLFVMIHKT
jgi:serine/threonine protein kinase